MIELVRDCPLRYGREFREHYGSHGPFEAELRQAGYRSHVETSVEVTDSDILRSRRMYITLCGPERVPVAFSLSRIPLAHLDQATRKLLTLTDPGVAGGITSVLEQAGREPACFTEDIRFRTALPHECFLGCPRVIDITHASWDAHDQLTEETAIALHPDMWTLHYQMDYPE